MIKEIFKARKLGKEPFRHINGRYQSVSNRAGRVRFFFESRRPMDGRKPQKYEQAFYDMSAISKTVKLPLRVNFLFDYEDVACGNYL